MLCEKMNKKCYLSSIGTYIPTGRISCDEIAHTHNIFERIYDKNINKPFTDESIIAIAAKSAERALSRAKINIDDIDLIIGSTTGPGLDVGLSFSAGVQNKLKQRQLSNCECIDVGVRCIGSIQSIDIARSKILLNSVKNVLIVLASKSSATLNDASLNANPSCVYFGDGAASAILTSDPLNRRLIIFGSSKVITHGEFWSASYYSIKKQTYNSSNLSLCFNKNVLNDKFKELDDTITKNILIEIAEKIGVPLKDIDGLVALNRSKKYKEALSEITGLPRKYIFTSQQEYGHLGPADLLVNLELFLEEKKKFRNAILLATSFGYHWGALPIHEL